MQEEKMRASMRCLALSALAAGLTLWVYSDVARGQATDPLIGTWKLNHAKSKFSPGPGPKDLTVRFQAADGGIKVTSDSTDADGKAAHTEYSGKYDGKENPITGSDSTDTVTLNKINATTSERIDKRGGKVVMTYTRKVSDDGKTLTVTQKGTDKDGKPVNNTLVFDKQ
jgi:hypothetical protein